MGGRTHAAILPDSPKKDAFSFLYHLINTKEFSSNYVFYHSLSGHCVMLLCVCFRPSMKMFTSVYSCTEDTRLLLDLTYS